MVDQSFGREGVRVTEVILRESFCLSLGDFLEVLVVVDYLSVLGVGEVAVLDDNGRNAELRAPCIYGVVVALLAEGLSPGISHCFSLFQ